MDVTSWRAWWWPERERVRMARTAKLLPPARSICPVRLGVFEQREGRMDWLPVSLSNFRVYAMEKKKSW